MRRGAVGSRKRIALLALCGLLALAILAQVLLPPLAASRISSRVGRYGKVLSVSVSAWPAEELLWGDAGSVKVRAGTLSLSPHQAAALLWEARGVSSLDVNARSLRLGTLALEAASLRKRGARLNAVARTTGTQVQAALPAGISVSLLSSGGGQVQVAASGSLFGLGASVQAVAGASGGELVVHPVAPLLEGFQLTLFADPHVAIEGIGAQVLASDPLTYGLQIEATLR